MAMRRWMVERPKDRLGSHRYQAEDFGLTVEQIRERLAGYIELYNISLTNTIASLDITGITQNTVNVTVSNTGVLTTSGPVTTLRGDRQ